MILPKPTTAQLMAELTYWPLGEAVPVVHMSALKWQQENMPWEWTPEEFEQQTKMLMAANCKPREMLAWLVHGVRWHNDENERKNVDCLLRVQRFSEAKGAYLRAWTRGTNGLIGNEGVEIICGKLDWHPVWKGQYFAQVVEDFCWAHRLSVNPSDIDVFKKPLSALGSLEIMKVTKNHDVRYACFSVMVQYNEDEYPKVEWMLGTENLVQWPGFEKLPLLSQRALLNVIAQAGPPKLLSLPVIERIHAIWSNSISASEQLWWERKSRSMVFDSSTAMSLLEQDVHPLQLIYRDRAPDLKLFKELHPDAFRWGHVLEGLMKTKAVFFELPDLQADSTHGPTA